MEQPGFDFRLRIVPSKPGVYLFKNHQNKVLYVGKAARLKDRIRSYFSSSTNHPPKIPLMMSQVDDFEFIVTDSSAEALILENTLIKKYRPHYNARLKDDKTYPYIKIDLTEDFPQVYITRMLERDGATYFGPFATAKSIRKTLNLLKKLFPYRSCTKLITGRDKQPCLEYYINRCVAPCTGASSKDDYHKVIEQIILFMNGKTDPVLSELNEKMGAHSTNLEFERAAIIRDQIEAIEQVAREQQIKTEIAGTNDLDVIGLATNTSEACIQIFFIRLGKLVGRDTFTMDGIEGDNSELIMTQFVKQFYQTSPYIPSRILLQCTLREPSSIKEWLKLISGHTVTIGVPVKGGNRGLVQMAAENAAQSLSQLRMKRWETSKLVDQALPVLQEELNLPNIPNRIECYDISNISGTNAVGSMVVFEKGVPKTKDYRRFKINEVDGINDYAMMQEMLNRRLRRLIGKDTSIPKAQNSTDTHRKSIPTKDKNWETAPDLIIIDGGKGHLSASLEVLLNLGIDNVPIASIAKENEWIFVPQSPEPIILPRNSQALYLVQRIRDEAHRFAITYHRQLRSKKTIISTIDIIRGIGPKRKKILLKRFGSIKGIREAPLEEITAVPGITHLLATSLKSKL